ncbi:MAG TPA: enoyl-CoA hydratase-related protein [Acidimicrobiales bacterium]|nr:enoyl-CoA hydratase-related protein [Acidimicrobiales bacterium]
MSQDYTFLGVETRDGVTVATMNGPSDQNHWQSDTEWELHDLAARTGADESARALVLTGAGEYFTSGIGLVVGAFDPFAFYERARALVNAFFNLDKPVVMAMNGPATGSGLTLALTGDIIIAEEQVTFIDAHVAGGTISATGSFLWPRNTGLLNAKRYLLTGEPFDAATACDIGLVTEVVARGKALDRALEYGAKFASMPPTGVQGTKRALNQWMRRASSEIFDNALAMEFLRLPAMNFDQLAEKLEHDHHGGAAKL